MRVCEDDEERMRTRNDRDGKLTVIWCGMNFIEPFLLVGPRPKADVFYGFYYFYIIINNIYVCFLGN